MKRILVIDDEAQYVESLVELLNNVGYRAGSADTYEKTLDEVASFKPQLMILDLDLKDGMEHTGAYILKKVRQDLSKADLPVLVVSGAGDPELCFQVLRDGANDYLVKPVDFPILLEKINRLLSAGPVVSECQPWENKLIGRSKLVMDLAKNVFQAAQTECDTLFLGETGCGKTHLANLYHQFSSRSDKPLVRIDLNPIPHELFETELFGYKANAFSGASAKDKPGRIDEANCGGILFLDEIGDLDLATQGKLLTLLDSKVYYQVGSSGNAAVRLNAVILTATNVNLYEKVKKGEFRKDLYYRLLKNVIECPALRKHTEDIPQLIDHYIGKFSREYHKPVASASPEVVRTLQGLTWDGNVRELIHCIGQAVKNCLDTQITLREIQPFLDLLIQNHHGDGPAPIPDLNMDHKSFRDKVIFKMERDYLLHHLKVNDWNVTKTAAAIGQSRQYLTELMSKFDIQRPKGDPEP